MNNDYKPGQILYIKPEYGVAYISVLREAVKRTYAAYELDSYELHTCCDLTIHEYDGNMYDAGVTFARGNGTLLDVDTNFEEVRQAEDFEKKMLFDALVRGFKDHDLGWENHFTDSTYFDILDWLAWEFDVDLDDALNRNTPLFNLGETISEIQDYIWDALCKETGNYQACTDYVEPEMVSLDKVEEFLESCLFNNCVITEDGKEVPYEIVVIKYKGVSELIDNLRKAVK